MRTWTLVVGVAVAAVAVGSVALLVSDDPSSSVRGADPALDTDENGTYLESENPTMCPTGARNSGEPRGVEQPRIVELYPNPTTDGNVGEFFVLETPPDTDLDNWTVTDGHTTARFPNETVSGRIAMTTDANVTARLSDDTRLELEGHLRLAANGDRLEVRNGSAVVDTVSYDTAPEAKRWYRHGETPEKTIDEATGDGNGDGSWWPDGATCRLPTTADVDDASTFVLPDSPDTPLETIRGAEDRLLIAGYTFTSERIATELLAASERGVDVRLLVESGPVGGTPEATEPILEELTDSGVEVRAIGGESARYRFHHPKYAIADETVLVTSENWKPSGVGGESSRGWGVTIENESIAAALETVFVADSEGRDTVSGTRFLDEATFVEEETNTRSKLPSTHDAETVPIDEVELLVAPDNAAPRLESLLADAEDEILVKQASIGGPELSILEETIEAADRGVEVRILLDSSWYVEDDNEALKSTLEQKAVAEEIPLAVSLVDPGVEFEKIHAKGVIIDGETTVVGSANWNENAFENNREVLLVVHGEEAAAYYRTVFEDDWEGATWSLPIELSLGTIIAVVAAGGVGYRYIRFGDEERASDQKGWSFSADDAGSRATHTGQSPDRNSPDTPQDDR